MMRYFTIAAITGTFFVACKPPKRESHRSAPPPPAESAATVSPSDQLLAQMPVSFYRPAAPTTSICPSDGATALTELPARRLSDAYQNSCSGCHGTAGEGRDDFPKLTGFGSEARLLEIVRRGGQRMPAFDDTFISDATLTSDFEKLSAETALTPFDSQLVAFEKPRPMDDGAFAATMRAGLIAWRTPGERGACMSCHGPDGIDLARLDYPTSAILRRSLGQGLASSKAIDIARMIAALRGRYGIDAPCRAKTFAPLQPGGSVIQGPSSLESERALIAALGARGVDLLGPISSASDAAAAVAAVAKLDVSQVPIALPLNRWTEDSFHGEGHRSTAEWIPEIPMEPKAEADLVSWIALQNTYLSDPNDANLWALLDAVPSLSGARFTAGGVSERLAREKYKSVLLLQHHLRHGNGQFPDLTKTTDVNRFSVWETAQITSVMARGCADAGTASDPYPCWKYPASFYKKMGTDRERLLGDVLSMTFPWLVAGWLQDPSLQLTEGGDAQMAHLHLASEQHLERMRRDLATSVQLPLHNLYMAFTRLIKSVEVLDDRFPVGAHMDEKPTHSCWGNVSPALSQWLTDTLPAIDRMLLKDAGAADADAQKQLSYSAISRAHRVILWMMKERTDHHADGCKSAVAEAMPLREAIAKIVAWHEKTGVEAGDVSLLARAIKP